MRRVLLALLLPLLAVAAPVPKSLKKSTDYFPVVVGHTWVYAEGSWEEVVEVTKVVEEDGVMRATLAKSVRPGFGIDTKYVVNSEGVWRVPPAGSDFDPLHELQFPLKAGASWAKNGSNDATAKDMEVGETEEVTVPAGTFTAIPVRYTYGGPDGEPRISTSWYAPGVGLVKMTLPSGEKVLRSFTPGMDVKK